MTLEGWRLKTIMKVESFGMENSKGWDREIGRQNILVGGGLRKLILGMSRLMLFRTGFRYYWSS
jgi:hypothetical protein